MLLQLEVGLLDLGQSLKFSRCLDNVFLTCPMSESGHRTNPLSREGGVGAGAFLGVAVSG